MKKKELKLKIVELQDIIDDLESVNKNLEGRLQSACSELSRLEKQQDGVSKMDLKTGSRTQGFITNKR